MSGPDPTPDPLVDPFADAGPGWMAGRTALVTGGGQHGELPGVGYATAVVLAGHGARVAVVDRDPAAAQVTVERIEQLGGQAHAVVADVTDDAACGRAVAATVERFGALDALVNNVAVGDRAGLFEVGPDRWDELMAVNLKSAWQVTRHAVPVLPPGAAIVNVSSVGVSARGPGMVYTVAKAGLENLSAGAAATLGGQGVRVNTVQVGAIWGAFAERNMPPEMREPRRRGIGLGTEGTSWDIAHAALFLLSDRARWISGHTLVVEGGPPRRFPPGPPITTVVGA
jgi:NAD(P)-dependent dehydrogenase (short-subunit alcohol dehydrogenase family)